MIGSEPAGQAPRDTQLIRLRVVALELGEQRPRQVWGKEVGKEGCITWC